MILCIGNKVKIVTCELKGVITPEQVIVHTSNHSDLIEKSCYYCLKTNSDLCIEASIG